MKEEWRVGIEFPVDCGLEREEAQLEDGETPRAGVVIFCGCKHSISANQQQLWLQAFDR
jgi:hypothetical protein